MNTSNIHEGQIFKNYPDLCKSLNEPVKNGKSKTCQLNDWLRYFTYEKDGHKFIIKSIKKKPDAYVELRGKKSSYIDLVEPLFVKWLLLNKTESNTFTFTTLQLCKSLGIVNQNYNSISNASINEQLNETINQYDIDTFYQMTNSTIKCIIEGILKSLKKRFLITNYENIYIIVRDGCHEVATLEEMNQITDVKYKVLHHLCPGNKKPTEKDIHLKRLTTQYYYEINEMLRDLYGWDGIYQAIQIKSSYKNLEKELEENERYIIQQEINHKVSKCIEQKVENKYQRNQESINEEIQNIKNRIKCDIESMEIYGDDYLFWLNEINANNYCIKNQIENTRPYSQYMTDKQIYILNQYYLETQKKLIKLLIDM